MFLPALLPAGSTADIFVSFLLLVRVTVSVSQSWNDEATVSSKRASQLKVDIV